MAQLFTKTDYKNFLTCGCYLWMVKKASQLLPPPSASDLFHQKEGEKVDALAKQLFQGGCKGLDSLDSVSMSFSAIFPPIFCC